MFISWILSIIVFIVATILYNYDTSTTIGELLTPFRIQINNECDSDEKRCIYYLITIVMLLPIVNVLATIMFCIMYLWYGVIKVKQNTAFRTFYNWFFDNIWNRKIK